MGKLKRSTRNIRWIEEHCYIPQGALVGQRVKLAKFQKDEIRKIYDNPHGTRRHILSMGRKNAKALALDTPIPTPSGWREMRDIQAGDFIYGVDGLPVKVLATSKVFTDKTCYKVGFSDGSEIVASGDHIWTTTYRHTPWVSPAIYRGGRLRGRGRCVGRQKTGNVTTEQIAQSVHIPRSDGVLENNHKIVLADALVSEAIDLPIPPYTLGAWLGDGASADARFTCGEEDAPNLMQQLRADGYAPRLVRNKGRAPTVTIAKAGIGCGDRVNGFQAALRREKLINNKHIPSQYFDAGTEQRWSLLQGLMDADGTALKGGQCKFTSTKEHLAESVWRLCRSLGLRAKIACRKATLYGKDCGASWSVEFFAPRTAPVFRLERKQKRLKPQLATRSKKLAIVSCERVESVPTKCLMVDSKDRLFLAGYGCVPTHNTTLSAFLLLLHLVGPEAKPNSQLFSAAQSREQAAILFSLAAKIVRMSPTLSEYVGIRDTAKELYCKELGTKYRALSADASTAYGLDPAFVVHDELGQVRGPRSDLYEALETSTGAGEAPLSIVISTQAPTADDLLSRLIEDAENGDDPRLTVTLYAAPEELDPFSDAALRAANPAFDVFMNREEVRAMAKEANRLPSNEAGFRNLILNQRVESNAPIISRKAWEACSGPVSDDWADKPVYGGLDLSSTTDLTALVLMANIEGIWEVRPTFWLPEQGLVERARADRVPYDLWHDQEYLNTSPGATIEYEWVAHTLRDVFDRYNVKKIAFDRWGWKFLKPWLEKAGFSERELECFEPFGQGFASMSPALRDLESIILQGKMAHGNHPVLTMCMANAVAQTDPSGNRKPDKKRSSGRIDGAVALTMAAGAAVAEAVPEEEASVWERLAQMEEKEREAFL